MHIAMYSPTLPSTGVANGIVTYARIMQAAMRAIGHRVTVFDGQGVEHPDGRVERIGPDRRWSYRLACLDARARKLDMTRRPLAFQHVLDRIAERDPIDILEMEESFGWVGRVKVDAPVVVRLHGPHFLGKDEVETAEEARVSVRRIAAEGRGIAAADAITSPSAKLLAATLDHYGLDRTHARVIPNPIPLAPAGERWSIDRCNPNQLLFVGRFDLRKGADIALEAFGLAASSNPALRLVMCGPDIGLPGPMGGRQKFEAFASERVGPDLRSRVVSWARSVMQT